MRVECDREAAVDVVLGLDEHRAASSRTRSTAASVDSTVKHGRQCAGSPLSATKKLAFSVAPLYASTTSGPPDSVSTISVLQPNGPW